MTFRYHLRVKDLHAVSEKTTLYDVTEQLSDHSPISVDLDIDIT